MVLDGGTVVRGIVSSIRAFSKLAVFPIYTEKQPQLFNRPCFMVQMVSVLQRRLVGNRFWRSCEMSIIWFPDKFSNTQNMDCRTIGEYLKEALLYIPLTELERPASDDYEPQVEFVRSQSWNEYISNDGLTPELHITFFVRMHVTLSREEIAKMQTLDPKILLKFERRD